MGLGISVNEAEDNDAATKFVLPTSSPPFLAGGSDNRPLIQAITAPAASATHCTYVIFDEPDSSSTSAAAATGRSDRRHARPRVPAQRSGQTSESRQRPETVSAAARERQERATRGRMEAAMAERAAAQTRGAVRRFGPALCETSGHANDHLCTS